jgi:hypothetical protein
MQCGNVLRAQSRQPFRKGPVKVVLFRKGPVKVALFRKGPVKVALFRQGPVKVALFRQGPVKVALFRQGPVKVALFRKGPVKVALFRKGPVKVVACGGISAVSGDAASRFQTAPTSASHASAASAHHSRSSGCCQTRSCVNSGVCRRSAGGAMRIRPSSWRQSEPRIGLQRDTHHNTVMQGLALAWP